MPNMNIGYVRPNKSLVALRDEVYGAYGKPARIAEFVTGYKSAGNFSGHNADCNGIVHAVDLFTDDNGNIPQPAGRALAEQLRRIGAATNRFSYLIHDMSEGEPAPMITGQYNGWVWQAYNGVDAHSDHIHVSTADLYWGDPCPVPASVYDSTAPWGIGSTTALAGNITQIETKPKEWDEMASLEDLKTAVRAVLAEKNYDLYKDVAWQVWDGTTSKAWNGDVSLKARLTGMDAALNGPAGSVTGRLDGLIGETVALRAAVTALAAGSGVTAEQIDKSIKEALANFTVTLATKETK